MAVKKTDIRPEVQVVGFYIGEDEYAVNISKVREIIAMSTIRKVPKAPSFVEGVINVRGLIVPIMDLRKRFDMEPMPTEHAEHAEHIEAGKTSKILIIELDNNQVGMIVDNVAEVMRLYVDEIEKAPPVFSSSVSSQYIQGVAKVDDKLIILLDVEKLLSFEEQAVLKSFG